MIKKELVFIKIGGSIITDKTKAYTLKVSNLRKIVKKIAALYNSYRERYSFIIGHGAGSFGHYEADKYKKEPTVFSASKIKYSVVKLNQVVFEEFIRQRLPAFSFSAANFITSSGSNVKSINLNPIITGLKNRFIPLFHGDVVLDTKNQIEIFSTERIFSLLIDKLSSEKFKTSKVIMISSELGVYDRSGRVISVIRRENFERINFYSSKGFDVTGGMELKVRTLLKFANKKIEGVIINIDNFCSPKFLLDGTIKGIKCTIIR